MDWITLLFACLLLAAALFDVRDRRIPNGVTVPGIVAGILLAALPGGIGVGAALLGLASALLVALVLFSLGAFGGGDGKLLLVVGAFMGPERFFYAFLAIAIIGGAMAVWETWRRGVLGATVRNTGWLMLSLVTFGAAGQRLTVRSPGVVTIPYGIAIASGSLLIWFGL